MASRPSDVPAVLLDPDARVGRTTSWITLIAFATALSAGLVPGSAEAGELPRVLVLPYAPVYDTVPATTGAKTAELLRTQLGRVDQVELVQMPEDVATTPAVGPTRDEAKLTEARKRVASADELLKKLKFKQAATELEKAIALFEAQHAFIEFNDLLDAYLSLAVARIRLNQEEEGEKLLATVVRLDPDRTLDPEKYPPVFIRMFERSAKKVKRAERGSLLVEPATAGATVFLDGREVGKAPLLIKDVIKGAHYLKVQPRGGKLWADGVVIESGKQATVRPQLGESNGVASELAAIMSRNVIDLALLERVAAIGRKAGADYVVLGGVHREQEKVIANTHLYRIKTGRLCMLQRVVFGEAMDDAGSELARVAADVRAKVELFGTPVTLPTRVSRDALAPAGHSSTVAEVSQGGQADGGRGPVARDSIVRVERREGGEADPDRRQLERGVEALVDDRPRRSAASEPGAVREITALSVSDGLTGADLVVPKDERDDDPSRSTWIWIAAGAAAVLVGGATGGFLYYRAATEPVTGTATINW